jgi:predicted acetyltransferase
LIVHRVETSPLRPRIEIVEASLTDKTVVRHLLELYQHDFAVFDGRDVDERGLYGYQYLDNYWTDIDRRPFLIRVDGHWAGLALVRLGPPIDMSEFFVMRKYRRGGVGRDAAVEVFRRLPGEWQVRQLIANEPATAFWREIIPVPYSEEHGKDGIVQRFVVEPG